MIEVASYFLRDDLVRVLGSLRNLPEPIRPIYIADSEHVTDSNHLFSDVKLVEKYIDNNRAGFFLHGDNCLYDIKLFSKNPSQLYLDLQDDFQDYLIPFFNAIVESNPVFSYAADAEERKHRNRCFKTIGENHIEDWVGRSICKYVSGLYCYTLLSKDLIGKHTLDIEELSASALSHVQLGSDGQFHLLKYYHDTRDWETHSAKLDELCYQTKGIFSIRNVLKATENINDISAYDDVIYNWR